ncbi:MAG: RDD family protein [Pyrinomonadaceae bacterium]
MSVRTEQSSIIKAGVIGVRGGDMVVRQVRAPAPFALRCGALLVDYTLTIAILAFATLMARLLGGSARLGGATALTFGYLASLSLIGLNFIVFAGFSGRTLGKWVTGLRIERRDGRPASFAHIIVRHLVGYPLSLLTCGLGLLIAIFSPEGRALHDLIAGTVVARSRRVTRRTVARNI